MQNCGRSIIQAKLADLEDRFGITSTEVNPAYSSQSCNACGYVDKRNRRIVCLWCGHIKPANLKVAPNIGQRRALATGSVFQMKDAVLAKVVRAFGERRVRSMRPGITPEAGAPLPTLGRRTLTFGVVTVGRGEVIRAPRSAREIGNDTSPSGCVM